MEVSGSGLSLGGQLMAIDQNYWFEQFERFSKLSNAELLEQIERPVEHIEYRHSPSGFGEKPPIWQPGPPAKEGEHWFQSWLKSNRHRICGHSRQVAMLLARGGLKSLCGKPVAQVTE